MWQGAGVYEDIRYEVDDPVAVITLNRPASLNAWTDKMGEEVRDAMLASGMEEGTQGSLDALETVAVSLRG